MTNIIDWNGTGDLCQGDVNIFRVPDSAGIDTTNEVMPRDGRLILAEGEVTGHHHAIGIAARMPQPAMLHDEALARELTATTAPTTGATVHTKAPTVGTANLYHDPVAMRRLIEMGELTDDRLAIGFLVVEGGPVVLRHEEHDAVRIPPGRYYVGAQREHDAAEERRVAD